MIMDRKRVEPAAPTGAVPAGSGPSLFSRLCAEVKIAEDSVASFVRSSGGAHIIAGGKHYHWSDDDLRKRALAIISAAHNLTAKMIRAIDMGPESVTLWVKRDPNGKSEALVVPRAEAGL